MTSQKRREDQEVFGTQATQERSQWTFEVVLRELSSERIELLVRSTSESRDRLRLQSRLSNSMLDGANFVAKIK